MHRPPTTHIEFQHTTFMRFEDGDVTVIDVTKHKLIDSNIPAALSIFLRRKAILDFYFFRLGTKAWSG